MLSNDDNGNDNNNNNRSIHDNNVGNLALDNLRGGFCCPQFQGRNDIWNVVFLGGKDNWRTLR